MILGTAGHIDHGKTTLVAALTGVDTDRLPEEKARGITIELGFAPLDLPDGTRLGVVDVPGHEGLVRTMVSGAAGIDLLLLVVAADEGVMPQTREHLAICALLHIRAGLVVLTKADLVEPDWLELAKDDVAALHGRALEALEVHGRTLAGIGLLDRVPVRLQAAHLRGESTGKHFDAIVDRETARRQRPGDHRAEALDGEHPVDREPRELIGRAGRDPGRELAERRSELGETGARLGGDREHGRPLEKRAAYEARHVVLHELEPVRLDEIALRQHHDPGADVEQRADREVFPRLRHHALVRRDDEHREVDAADARQHVLHEALVAGDVDDLDREAGLLEEREPQIDGDAPRLLLGQAIRVDSGEGLHEGGLAVVDVAGGADHDVPCGAIGCQRHR